MSGVQTTFGGVCGAKKGGLALHFGLESAQCITYIHTSEHLDERRLMEQWWANYLASNCNKYIAPYN